MKYDINFLFFIENYFIDFINIFFIFNIINNFLFIILIILILFILYTHYDFISFLLLNFSIIFLFLDLSLNKKIQIEEFIINNNNIIFQIIFKNLLIKL